MLLLLLPLMCTGSLAQDSYWLEVEEQVTVQEGLCVYVPCRFAHPWTHSYYYPSLHGYWFREGANIDTDAPVATNNPKREVLNETQGRFLFLGYPKNFNCSLFIRDARKEDQGKYFYRVEIENSMHNYKSKLLQLRVTALTHTPHILVPEMLQSGCSRNLTCSVPWACESGTPPSFSWIGDAVTSQVSSSLLSSVLTLKPQPQDHGSNLTCRVTFPAANVTVERTVQLNVAWQPGYREGIMQGALWGAGVTTLLAVLLILLFFLVKNCRKGAARAAVGTDDSHPDRGTASQADLQESTADAPAGPPNSAGAGPSLGQEQEVHYATLSFHMKNPQEGAPRAQ
ncbi:myeloid cell surface antigen CD33-like [Erinaceus europaeus]|uniref:Myeloid cell surface antigen CD33-like n=1 Tax=Erinaceus europaeus TaxID=9365 RepID=A0ABM3W3R2_ERIEU|nr:myeloid cell surface antigen CD33-like [Erinaceus europaeus]